MFFIDQMPKIDYSLNRSQSKVLTGEEAKKVLDEILESERKSRSLTFPAHTGATGFFYEKPRYVAFDNSSNDCWVEEFRTATGARKWCQGLLSTDQVNELEDKILRDRQLSRDCRTKCIELARQLNGRGSGGDSDGVAYFVDKPFMVSFTEDELSDWTNRFSEQEKVVGVYFSDNRIVPADFVILQRGNRIDAEQFPYHGLSFYSQLSSVMKMLADDPKCAKSHSVRVLDNDSRRDFTLAEVVPLEKKGVQPNKKNDSPHFETFLHALEYSRRQLLSESGVSFSELECPKGYVATILLSKDTFPVLNGKGLSDVDSLPPGVKFDKNGEFAIEMEFHDGFAYDLNPHGYGFFDRVALYYPTLEECDKTMQKHIRDYTGRDEITPFDVALKYGQASRMRCPDYRMEAAKKAVIDRATDPSARAFTPEQRKAIELAADCGGYFDRPKGRAFFYDGVFCNSEKAMGNIPRVWKADVKAELRDLAKGEKRSQGRGMHR